MHYHRNAKTNINQRLSIKSSSESSRELAKKYEVSHVTIAKWKKADKPEDKKSTPQTIHYAVPKEFWQIIKKVRQKILMPLDDLFLSLEPYIPNLNRTNCYRILKYFKLNKLNDKEKKKAKKFKKYLPGYLHIDVFYLPKIGKKRYYCFLAIDRATRMVFLEIYEHKGKEEAADFLVKCLSFFPFRVYCILTDNGREFTSRGNKPFGQKIVKKEHLFELACQIFGIEHRKTKPRHPWTNGMAERMVRTTKEHTVRITKYSYLEEIIVDIKRFQLVHNFQRKLKILNFKSPYEVVLKWFDKNPEIFIFNPNDLLTRL